MLVKVDSNYISNPSSKEIFINKKGKNKENFSGINDRNTKLDKRHLDEHYSCKDHIFACSPFHRQNINLQTDDNMYIDDQNEEDESFIISYLKNKHTLLDPVKTLPIGRNKSSILEKVPKMESIPEDEPLS